MWNRLLQSRNRNDHSPMTNARRILNGIWSLVISQLWLPAMAWAHGDDNLTAGSFLGPLLFVAVLAVGLRMGRPVIRWLVRRG